MSAQPKLRFTLEEYLEMDRNSDERTFRNLLDKATDSGYTASSIRWKM
jgi:hypothetical protein